MFPEITEMYDFSSGLWSLPGPNRFISKAGNQLKDRFNIIFLIPGILDHSEFRQSLLNYLEIEMQMYVQVVDLAYSNGGSPFQLLKEVFPGLEKYRNIESSVQDLSLPDVIILDNFEGCSAKNRHEWLLAISRWADASSRCSGNHSIALIAKHQSTDGVRWPDPEIKLVYQVWSGMPSSLDIKMLCRLRAEHQDGESQWRENILASLVGNDLGLVERLWDVILEDDEAVFQCLCKYAQEKGWNSECEGNKLKNWRPMTPGSDVANKFDPETFRLLGQGITIFTPEFGEEIHSALVALLNRRNELNHRIWRAQANLLLPLIDDCRRRICDYMVRVYGEGWAILDGQQHQSPVEWGTLKCYIQGLDWRSWEKQQWGSGVKLAWTLRNALAHYEIISYRNYIEFWRFYSSVHNILFQLPD